MPVKFKSNPAQGDDIKEEQESMDHPNHLIGPKNQ
jgi:hypothetical protein